MGEGQQTTSGQVETTATVEHGEHGAENPLAEYHPFYYSGVALVVAIGLVVASVMLTRNLKTRAPRWPQLIAEWYIGFIDKNFIAAIGSEGKPFLPLVGTIFAFVLCSNLTGAILPTIGQRTHEGVKGLIPAPTSNLSMTIALALVVFVVVQAVAIQKHGFGGYIKHFMGPIPVLAPLMFPLEIIGAIAKPISLAIRLFGNIFGEETIVAVLVGLAASSTIALLPVSVVGVFPMMAFGVFGSLVQAGVFTILSSAYIALSIGEHEGHEHEHTHAHDKEEDEFAVAVPAPAH